MKRRCFMSCQDSRVVWGLVVYPRSLSGHFRNYSFGLGYLKLLIKKPSCLDVKSIEVGFAGLGSELESPGFADSS